MKTALLKQLGKFEIHDTPKPQLEKDTDVLINIKMVGMCGSDIHYYTTGRIGEQIVKYPFIVGHEAAGVVEQVGAKVKRVKPGQRVAIDPAINCGVCDQCKAGRGNTCHELVFMGNPAQREGALCEYIVHDEKSLFPIANETSFEKAVISEPLAIAVYAVEQSRLKPGGNVGILGFGPIGMSVFQVLRTTSVGNIYVTDKIQYRLDLAKELGATWCGNPDDVDVESEITENEPSGLDIVYECSGDHEILKQAIALLKPGGILAIIGIPEVDDIAFPIHKLRRKEITILNIRRQSDSTQKAIDLLESGKVDVDKMATHHFKLEDTQAAFDLVSNYRDNVMKAMITVD